LISTTVVFPSARAIRHEQLNIENQSLLLPKYITINEFIANLCIVENYKAIDEDSRVLLLLEASDFKEFSNLQIERNFFTFTKNSSYIFKFYEELSAELYDIKNLDTADIYAEYEEHITILQELYRRYEAICNERALLDKIFLPKLYRFNTEYVKRSKKIFLHINGHFTNFEFELLERSAEYTEVEIFFKTTEFNKKMQSKFSEMGVELESGFNYTISLNRKEVISKERVVKQNNISCESFSEPLLQVAFIKKEIYKFIEKGYKAQNIAVVLPDEKMAEVLKSFDEKHNFNFAMGESYQKSSLYIKLNATIKMIEQDSKENIARVQRVGYELYSLILAIYYKSSEEVDFILFLESLKEYFGTKNEIKIYEEEIFKLKNILSLMSSMNIKSLFSIFLQRLATRTLDDTHGGKITVMGVLETRGVEFDAVVIVDFSDKNVPKRSDKDMFLNTKIREIADLPTMSDRENLQKHYYETLIENSKEVAISFVKSTDSSGSRFLKQLGIVESKGYDERLYSNLLFERVKKHTKVSQPIVLEYSFKDVNLSATRLKSFLSCKRNYYYRYIKHIDGHEIPKDMPKEYEVGNTIHSALANLYSKKNFYSDAKELQRDLERELDSLKGKSELDKYLIAIEKRRLEKFCEDEIERFNEGWRVAYTEESLSSEFCGIRVVGQLDRVDMRGSSVEVLDYKTGNYILYNKNNFQDAVDFQLEFYYILASSLGDVSCAFYDLKESKVVYEPFLEEKLEILKSIIKDLLTLEEVNFEMCEDLKVCSYCPYATICGRE
jgi:RecB family exonuclease